MKSSFIPGWLPPSVGTDSMLEVLIEDEVHGKAKVLAHLLLEGDEAQEVETVGLLGLDEDIDVAVGSGVATGPASKDP